MNPYSQAETDALTNYLNNDRSKNVTGFILKTAPEEEIVSDVTYAWPQIMSEVENITCVEFQNFSYNLQPGFNATYSHTFIQNCWVLDPIVPVYYVYGAMWAAIAIGYYVAYRLVPEAERISVQWHLAIVLALKCVELCLNGAYLSKCPFHKTTWN